jgi:quercetin dioxygenase-like cupin family protein
MQAKEIIDAGSIQIHYHLDGNDTNRQLSMFKAIIAPGAAVPLPHYHEAFDETIYALMGTITFTVDGKKTELRAGDALFIPRASIHHFENKSTDTATFLCFCNPGLLSPDYFHDVQSVLSNTNGEDTTRLKEIMLQHGIVPVLG